MSNAYAVQLQTLKATFAGTIAEKVADYATNIIQRDGARWDNASPFQYGSPHLQADGSYHMNVWHEMTGHTIRLRVAFIAAGIEVRAESTRHEKVILESTLSVDYSPESVALAIGGQFERAETGMIYYSRDEYTIG